MPNGKQCSDYVVVFGTRMRKATVIHQLQRTKSQGSLQKWNAIFAHLLICLIFDIIEQSIINMSFYGMLANSLSDQSQSMVTSHPLWLTPSPRRVNPWRSSCCNNTSRLPRQYFGLLRYFKEDDNEILSVERTAYSMTWIKSKNDGILYCFLRNSSSLALNPANMPSIKRLLILLFNDSQKVSRVEWSKERTRKHKRLTEKEDEITEWHVNITKKYIIIREHKDAHRTILLFLRNLPLRQF